MTSTRLSGGVLLLGVVLVLGSGCAHDPSKEEDEVATTQAAFRGLGYYEVKHEGNTYIVGSMPAVDAVKEGKVPKQTIVRYSTGGTRVLIDASEPAEAARLTHEYDRRHRLAR